MRKLIGGAIVAVLITLAGSSCGDLAPAGVCELEVPDSLVAGTTATAPYACRDTTT